MKILLLAALAAGAAFVFNEASQQIEFGEPWAAQVCSASQTLCHHPEWLLFVAVGLVILFVGREVIGY